MDETQPRRIRWGEWLQGPPILASRDAPKTASLWLSRLHWRVDLAVHDFRLLKCFWKACANATNATQQLKGVAATGIEVVALVQTSLPSSQNREPGCCEN